MYGYALLRFWFTTVEAECFTLAAVAVLRQLQAGLTTPAGVGSWVVQAQLAQAHVSHQALIDIWTEKYGRIIPRITVSGLK